ncbi:hypothetical protein ONE63_006829 [Megalurothrips usitatus]|uniref:Cuticle protein 6 n=1 Tax=Megalurothrips usitatus TaxID=439358 RepID=A0AAV7XSN3_9NEOP|nr:hypothetical protein ONE63_006829 [Megalurothrips usitatus]
MAAPSSAVHYNYHPAVYAPPPVQLWFLTPSEVAELVSRIPLSDYREVSPHAPVAARYTPADRHLLRQEQVDVSQFHTQDGAGRAVFGYSTADQVRVEARSGDGRVRGSYSYRDPTGKVVKVNYWDDGDGFHVAGNSLPSESDVPEPVTETPEVAAARLQHESLHAQALQSALLAGNGEETDQTRVEGPSGDLPPVYDEDGTELRRYPAPQHASLYDPSHVHDVERDAVIISNPDLEPDSFNDIQLFRSRVGAAASSAGTPSAAASARARGYHPRQRQQQVDAHGRARRQTQHDDEQQLPLPGARPGGRAPSPAGRHHGRGHGQDAGGRAAAVAVAARRLLRRHPRGRGARRAGGARTARVRRRPRVRHQARVHRGQRLSRCGGGGCSPAPAPRTERPRSPSRSRASFVS